MKTALFSALLFAFAAAPAAEDEPPPSCTTQCETKFAECRGSARDPVDFLMCKYQYSFCLENCPPR
ncbi:hypothetical protein [Polyangium jinanense]|uniref:ShKT domain-containing protein n=1 Tax=Polyangium jinanense TaxID=2829994 RepID=A0A9X3XAD3_9BACT|nr:hypothetical protein [Polyangium jinanense]MDC3960172.1 hypothetical protein [Polyangium jinanense]MDC3986612.1 hypothetical protein [Polyangium jinanense]